MWRWLGTMLYHMSRAMDSGAAIQDRVKSGCEMRKGEILAGLFCLVGN